ncbi:MAG: ribonucleoside-diphosphate reductase subunit alpha [Desulfobulbus propionicus]|nr:MAG: ribonucleoside-diphosphate reductase subunit alpha [Desulfobulbus propionicus]
MKIRKRDGNLEEYDISKIENAVQQAFTSVEKNCDQEQMNAITTKVESLLNLDSAMDGMVQVEDIQDQVERALTELNHYEVLKSYIIYRNERSKSRRARQLIVDYFPDLSELDDILKDIQKEYTDEIYYIHFLTSKFISFYKKELSLHERLTLLVKAAVELTTQEAPKWEYIAARILILKFRIKLYIQLDQFQITSFYSKLKWLTAEGLYGKYILDAYSKEEIEQCASFLDEKRDRLLNYSALDLLLTRYVIRSHSNQPLEEPQEMFLGIAMHLAMKEGENRLMWVRRFYDMLSTLKVTMATPTLANARKPYFQLSSCFIDTVPDSLEGIYRSIDNFARVSKFGGGMGLYFGKVRSSGSDIRGFKGAAGGVIRWIRLANDTAVAVDQLGVRQGAVAVYLDAWHKDIPEFLGLRTNNGDDRMKAHDVFPAICYPDLFWKKAKEDIDGNWHLMCPHEIKKIKGYCLEDCYGEEWENRYLDCVNDSRISKRTISMKDMLRLIIKSAVETGTPFTFNRDQVNAMNPNSHRGIIYCSNLCTEIAQNMDSIRTLSQTIEEIDGEKVVVTVTKPGEFVVCNLASLSLGNIDLSPEGELEEVTESAVRALDNVIDLNYFPLPYAKINNEKYRPIGLGISGYHHMLAKKRIPWESEEHLSFVDKLFERINLYAIRASKNIALEKGSYEYFPGSDWQNGEYFTKRGYDNEHWRELREEITQHGLRNGYLMAIAPTSSTSIIGATTAGVDPIMNRYFLEEKKNGTLPRVAPELSAETTWYYKNAHVIDQQWSVKAAGVRSRHIDQAQSMNLYITNEYTFRGVLNLYLLAWEKGVKTIYYIRSKSLEVEECESCSS